MADLLKGYSDENLFTIRPPPLVSHTEAKKFHSVVAKLLHISKRTTPDILTLAAFLTTRVQAPTEDDLAKLERGMKYFVGTSDLALTLHVEGPSV